MGDPSRQSAEHQALAQRLRCYREKIVRRLVVKHGADAGRPDWVEEAGWTAQDEARYHVPPDLAAARKMLDQGDPPEYASGLGKSTADILKYKAPTVVPCSEVAAHPVVPADADDSVFKALARIFLAREDPARQRELFGWTRPATSGPAELASFERIKAAYWERVCGSDLQHLTLLKDTADFHANDLLRVLYLAGELPVHLWEKELPGRAPGDIRRDDNFSEGIEHRITQALLAFKYWIDDPFYLTTDAWPAVPANPGDQSVAGQTAFFALPPAEAFYPGDLEALSAARKAALADPNSKEALDQDMTYWSENHQVLFATAEYLAGQWLPDAVFRAGLPYRTDKEAARPGDLTGEQRMRHARPRLIGWLEERLRFGFAEWHAPGYYAEDLRALFNLADFCLDQEIRLRAQMVLDLMFFDLARLNLNGNFGVTAGRCYFNQKTCSYDQSVGDLITVMFGTRDGVIVWDGDEAAGSLASSAGYSVPEVLLHIALDRPERMVDRTRVSLGFEEAAIYGVGRASLADAVFWWGRSAYFAISMLQFSQSIAIRYRLTSTPPFTQVGKAIEGLDKSTSFPTSLAFSAGEAKALAEGPSLTRANLYTYKSANTMLSSVQNFHAGQLGTQVQACQATIGPAAVVWTSHLSAGGYVNPRPTIFGVAAVPFGPAGGGIALGITGMTGDAADQEVIPPDWPDGPNWWTGSATLPRVVQHEGAAILAYNPKDLEDIFGAQTHAWFPKPAFGDSVQQRLSSNCNADDGNWTFGRVDDAYVGLFSAREVTWTSDGPWAERELMAEAGRNIFIIQVGNAEQFGSYDAFIDKLAGARVHINGLHWGGSDFECSYDIASPSGGRLELHDDGHQARLNGVMLFNDYFPRFESPYVKCGRVAWGQYHYTIAFDGLSLTHDFRELRTKAEGAIVHRLVGEGEHDCESERFWVAANRGARRLFPENTIAACRHAVQEEGAMALLVDACLTRDGEVVLWHDWNPDDLVAVLRQLGVGDLGAYRPQVPDAGDSIRRETIELTLAQLRVAFGYVALAADDPAQRAPFVVPTLAELLDAARGWPGLRQLLLEIRLPAEQAGEHGAQMMESIAAAFEGDFQFGLTLLVGDAQVLAAMQGAAAPGRIAFSWLGTVPDFPRNEDGSLVDGAREDAIRNSPVEAAIAHRTSVVTLERSFSADPHGNPGASRSAFEDYNAFVAHDVARLEPFNLNPRENQGHQIERLLAAVRDDASEMATLVAMGVSGIVTDDVKALRAVLADAGRS